VPQAFLQHTGEKGVHGGKSKVPPVRHVHSVHQRTKQIPIGWQSTLCNAQGAGKAGIGLIGLIGPIGLMAQGYVGAMRSGNSKAQGAEKKRKKSLFPTTEGKGTRLFFWLLFFSPGEEK
ncbi:MAG: hypothetical protein IKD46_07460, partial [Lentisphaeria bacterium]|nr:hypothetical protein [Lentisphaeria bacterium]